MTAARTSRTEGAEAASTMWILTASSRPSLAAAWGAWVVTLAWGDTASSSHKAAMEEEVMEVMDRASASSLAKADVITLEEEMLGHSLSVLFDVLCAMLHYSSSTNLFYCKLSVSSLSSGG